MGEWEDWYKEPEPMDEFEARLIKQEERYEKGADDKYHFPDHPDVCEYCGGVVAIVTDNNYGADADGRRGIKVQWVQCMNCGEQPREGEGE